MSVFRNYHALLCDSLFGVQDLTHKIKKKKDICVASFEDCVESYIFIVS